MKHKKIKVNKDRGQVMILSVLLISTAVLAAATFAGVMVIFQLRQTAGAESSAQAIFAADAGIERALYAKYREGHCSDLDDIPQIRSDDPGEVGFALGGVNHVVIFNEDCSEAYSAGQSSRSARAFQVFFAGLEEFGGQGVSPPPELPPQEEEE